MKLFIQGLRRSATTIVYDILAQDGRLDCYYEPFAAGRKIGAMGGGSGIQKIDFMEKIRATRISFINQYKLPLSEADFNYGAPFNPSLELKNKLPKYCHDYLNFMLYRREHTVFKFTRMYRKVRELKALAPQARFLLLVRHPQEVVASYMYGRDQRNQSKFSNRESFFSTRDQINPWNSRKFFEAIIREQKQEHLVDVPNWMRYLIIWKYTFDHAYRDGIDAFGDAFFLLRHEDLVLNPRQATLEIYAHIGLPPIEQVLEWAATNVRRIQKKCYENDPRWVEAYDLLQLNESLAVAGYDKRRPVS